MQAIWNDRIVADSDDVIVVEGKHYFPFEAIHHEFLEKSDSTSESPQLGTARYYTLSVEGQTNPDAAWCYTQPKEKAAPIRGRVAFWRGVKIMDQPSA